MSDPERAVLGACLLRGRQQFADLADELDAADFADAILRRVWEAMRALPEDAPIETLTVARRLGKGSDALVAQLLDECPSAEHATHYAKLVREAANQRRMLQVLQERLAEGRGVVDPSEWLSETEGAVVAIGQRAARGGYVTMGQAASEALREVEQRKASGAPSGVASGLRTLDAVVSACAGNSVVIAARPKVGKTSFALNWGLHAARRQRVPGLIFSAEMDRRALARRNLALETRVGTSAIREGWMNAGEWAAVRAVERELQEVPLYVEDVRGATLQGIRSSARRFARDRSVPREGPHPGFLMVDYLQLVSAPTRRRREENRQMEVTEISKGLKQLAMDLGMPLLLLAQLNRASAKEDRRPLPSDLRESGAIEQDADIILMLHPAEAGVVEIGVTQRDGASGMWLRVAFEASTTRFADLAPPPAPEQVPMPGWVTDDDAGGVTYQEMAER